MLTDAIAGGLIGLAILSGAVCAVSAWSEPDNDGACTLAAGAAILGFGTYALASPIIHLTYGRPGQAAAALGLRIGLPVVAGIVEHSLDGRGALLPLLGICAAVGIDWFVLSVGDDGYGGPGAAFAPLVTREVTGGVIRGRF